MVTRQGPKVVEEGVTPTQREANLPISRECQRKDGAAQKGVEHETEEHGREILVTVPIVVLETVALGLEKVVVLVLDFPTATTPAGDVGHGLGSDR